MQLQSAKTQSAINVQYNDEDGITNVYQTRRSILTMLGKVIQNPSNMWVCSPDGWLASNFPFHRRFPQGLDFSLVTTIQTINFTTDINSISNKIQLYNEKFMYSPSHQNKENITAIPSASDSHLSNTANEDSKYLQVKYLQAG